VTIDATWGSVREGATTDRDGIELGINVAGPEGSAGGDSGKGTAADKNVYDPWIGFANLVRAEGSDLVLARESAQNDESVAAVAAAHFAVRPIGRNQC